MHNLLKITSSILKCDMIGVSQFILLKRLYFVKAINAIIALSLQKLKYAP